jgi:plastocyanin
VTIGMVGKANRFDVTAPTVAAGSSVTIVFDNADAGVMHNVHVFAGPGASSGSLASSDLVPGPMTQVIAVGTLSGGTYFYRCDVHPTSMTGRINVV